MNPTTPNDTLPTGRGKTYAEWLREKDARFDFDRALRALDAKLAALDLRNEITEAIDGARAGDLVRVPATEDASRAMREGYGRACVSAYFRSAR